MAKYKLTAQAVLLLRQIVSFQGSAKTIEDMYRAGRLLVVTLPDTEGQPINGMVEFEMDGLDRDFCKAALTHSLSREILPNSEYTYELVTALELVIVQKAPVKAPR